MANRIDVANGLSMKLALKTCVALATLATMALSYAGPSDSAKKIDFELTGTVYDADTKEPLEGAFVVAPYKIFRGGIGASGTFCVKTKGMYTGRDGKYHFPVEKLDGRNPYSADAIKPGYYLDDSVLPDPKVWAKQTAAAYSGRDIFLKKQNPSKPHWTFSGEGDEVCTEARTREAAAAGVTFMKLKYEEQVRLGAPETFLRLSAERIKEYENLPEEVGEDK